MNPVTYKNYFTDTLKVDLPPIPTFCENRIKNIATGVFGSVNPEKQLYNLNDFLGEITSKPVTDYVVLGVDEKNGDTVCYYAVNGPLALFVQLPVSEKNKINNTFAAVKALFDTLKMKQEKISKDERLLVVLSHHRGSGCQWIKGLPGKIDETKWEPNRPLLQALNALSLL